MNMKNRLFVLITTLFLCLSLIATDNMCVKLKYGNVIPYNISDIEEVFFCKDFKDTSSINPNIEDTTVVGAFATKLKYKLLSNSTVEVIGYETKELGSIVVPIKVRIDGDVYTVTGIGDGAFKNCSGLTNIEIHSKITNIGLAAFQNCNSLETINVNEGNSNYSTFNGVLYDKSVSEVICVPRAIENYDFPSSVTNIGDYAFYNCDNVTNIEVPSSVVSIGDYAFYNCTNANILIDNAENTVKVGNKTFEKCKSVIYTYLLSFDIVSDSTAWVVSANESLDSIIIPAKVLINKKEYDVTGIRHYAFASLKDLKYVNIPSSIEFIGDSAFAGCKNLEYIEIPSSVVSIGDYAFADCINTNVYIDNVKSNVKVKAYSFDKCKNIYYTNRLSFRIVSDSTAWVVDANERLDSIIIPAKVLIDKKEYVVTGIDYYAFLEWNVEDLKYVYIPTSIEIIGDSAFAGCKNLENIEIPSSVSYIGGYAFDGCTELTAINVDTDNMKYSSDFGILYDKEKETIILVPCGVKGNFVIPSSVTNIMGGAFYNCEKITNIEIPSSVVNIGDRAFYNCDGLTSIEIPSSVTYIGWDAFRRCYNLDVVIDNSKENFRNAFSDCKSVTYLR